MKNYILIHTHKHGIDYHLFKSKKEIRVGWYDDDDVLELQPLFDLLDIEFSYMTDGEWVDIISMDHTTAPEF